MQFTKMEVAGCDFLLAAGKTPPAAPEIERWLHRRKGIGGEGLLWMTDGETCHAYDVNGKAEFGIAAALAAAKFSYERDGKVRRTVSVNAMPFATRVSRLRDRVLCVWGELPPITARPMEQLRYYYGVRGDLLRACLAHPRVSVYELCGDRAVFLIESANALRRLDLAGICRRFDEVLFFGERICLHFAAPSGENSICLRSWQSHVGEVGASGEGAAVAVYAATEAGWLSAERTIVRFPGGTLCVELFGKEASVCAKCETLFTGAF